MSTYTVGAEVMRGVNNNKEGIIKPDENGWYLVNLGALEYPNSRGEIYDEGSARAFLTADNPFTRKLRKGCLAGELGHPMRETGMTDSQWLERVLTIAETNESHTIMSVTIDTTAVDRSGRRYTAIRGKVKPSGPHKQILLDKFADPNINVCFSVRSFAKNIVGMGGTKKHFLNIITFDYVLEPGLAVANKYESPALESHTSDVSMLAIEQYAVKLEANKSGLSMESANEAKEVIHDVMKKDSLYVAMESAAQMAQSAVPQSVKFRNW